MLKISACSAIAKMVSLPMAYAQTYKTPSENPALNQIHTTPSIMDDDGNIDIDPAMTSRTNQAG